jgi:hypothetical protein
MLSESAVKAPVIQRLEPFFNITEEVRGVDAHGRRVRIDAIVTPKDPSQWARPDIALGIEFKAMADRDRKGISKVAAQCVDYARVNWSSFGFVPVFMCPGFGLYDLLNGKGCGDLFTFDEGVAFATAGLLGQCRVGELSYSELNGLQFVINGIHIIWGEYVGVRDGRSNRLAPEFGHRK